MKIRPVILSGGSGTRLWPISRQNLPKQFVPILGQENLFLTTLRSVCNRTIFEAPLIVGNSAHKFLILDMLEQLSIKDATLILEPTAKNTAAAILMALAFDQERYPNCLHLIRPSDHILADNKKFLRSVMEARPAADNGSIVLFGIQPTFPETGYGYIVPDARSKNAIKPIRTFKEKPSAITAKDLIKKGALWNSGIFFYRTNTLASEANDLAHSYWTKCKSALRHAQTEPFGLSIRETDYNHLESRPFDRLIMEKTQKGSVLPCSFGWNDVGSWQSLWNVEKKDKSGNVVKGTATLENSKNCYVRSDGPSVAVLGAEDLVVISTKDAVLVAPLSQSQDIKSLVTAIEMKSPHMTQDPPVARRRWGTHENLAIDDHYQVRHVVVHEGCALATQKHKHRSEHWVVVSGTAKVLCGTIEKLIHTHQSIFIPKGTKHRLSNPGPGPLHIIEVQSGDLLSEKDVVRY